MLFLNKKKSSPSRGEEPNKNPIVCVFLLFQYVCVFVDQGFADANIVPSNSSHLSTLLLQLVFQFCDLSFQFFCLLFLLVITLYLAFDLPFSLHPWSADLISKSFEKCISMESFCLDPFLTAAGSAILHGICMFPPVLIVTIETGHRLHKATDEARREG